MLDKFKWDQPERSSGAQGAHYIKIDFKPSTADKKKGSKYSFTLSKGLGEHLKLEGDTLAGISWDENKAIILAVNLPKNLPGYNLRKTSTGGWVFANKRFVVKAVEQVGFTGKEPKTETGIFQIYFDYKEIGKENDTTFFKLTKVK